MIDIHLLPHILAVINVATVVVLLVSYWFIQHGNKKRHRAGMLVAAVLGAAFLAIYLTYHFSAGLAKFGGHGTIRPIYFTLLSIHVLMALVVALLVPVTLVRALGGSFAAHRKVASWALPVWLFVSVSGVVVYVMAIHIYPYTGA
jgi:putative membrane protein